jgi:hypothetical protein
VLTVSVGVRAVTLEVAIVGHARRRARRGSVVLARAARGRVLCGKRTPDVSVTACWFTEDESRSSRGFGSTKQADLQPTAKPVLSNGPWSAGGQDGPRSTGQEGARHVAAEGVIDMGTLYPSTRETVGRA